MPETPWLHYAENELAPMCRNVTIGSAKLNGIDPQRYLTHILERIAGHPIIRIDDLLPWVVAPQLRAAWQPSLAEAA